MYRHCRQKYIVDFSFENAAQYWRFYSLQTDTYVTRMLLYGGAVKRTTIYCILHAKCRVAQLFCEHDNGRYRKTRPISGNVRRPTLVLKRF